MPRPAPSTTPLALKLGLKSNQSMLVIGAPAHLAPQFEELPEGASVVFGESASRPGAVLCFVQDRAELAARAPRALAAAPTAALLWFAYPKRTGSLPTDLTRDHGWDELAKVGLVGVAMVAVDDTWAAMRFRRREDTARRPGFRAIGA